MFGSLLLLTTISVSTGGATGGATSGAGLFVGLLILGGCFSVSSLLAEGGVGDIVPETNGIVF